jgi:hypothetical protein
MTKALLTALAVLAAVPAAASARVLVVTTGTPEIALVDVATRALAARLDAGLPTRAVAVAPDGATAWVGAGPQVVALDPNLRVLGAARADLGADVLALAASPRGGRVYALLADRLVILDARTLARLRSVPLRGQAIGTLAISRDGALAAAPLAGNRVAIVALGAARLLRRTRVRRAAGAAFDARGRLWVSASDARLYPVRPYARRKAVGKSLKLGRGVGGAIAASPNGARLLVGAAGSAPRAAFVDVGARRARGLRTGRGPGVPAW